MSPATPPYRQAVEDLEYVRVPVYAKANGVVVNPTTDVAKMAFKTAGAHPSGADWKTSIWETDATTQPATYYVLCLVGPGGTTTLTAGTYTVWVQVTDNPEIPVKESGTLVMY